MSTEKARVIRPMTITPDSLVYSNVPEDDHDAWAPGTYAKDAWVMHKHRIWQALRETTKEPGAADAANDWNDGGATNRWRFADRKVGSQTVRQSGIIIEIHASQFVDSIAVLNVFANRVKVQMIHPDEGVVFEREARTFDVGVSNWWQYFFKRIRRRKDVIIDNLPPYAGVTIRVELIVAPGSEARVGALILGSRFDIGCALWGTSVGFRDFTKKDEDQYGNLDVIEGPWSKRPELDLVIETSRVDEVMEELIELRAIPCVYIGHSRHTMTVAYGFFRELMVVLSGPTVSECTLTIEALT